MNNHIKHIHIIINYIYIYTVKYLMKNARKLQEKCKTFHARINAGKVQGFSNFPCIDLEYHKKLLS